MSAELPRSIQAYVRSFVTRRRWLATLRALSLAVAMGMAWTLLACLADRMLRLPPMARLFLLIADALLVAAILTPALHRLLRRRIDWVAAAAEIEAANPTFAQRLRTVVSQLMERNEYRGSNEMLRRLVDDVAYQTAHDRPGRWVKWRSAARPWLAAAFLGAIGYGLWMIPKVGMGVLVGRFATPLAGISPVTTTRIAVDPGSRNVQLNETLVIRATAQRLTGTTVDILMTQDDLSWSRIPMLPVSDSEYIFTLPAIQRDLKYYIEGGDARTDVYRVSVLRPPAVAELRLRYEYPAYARREPVSVTSTDGIIEALTGTKVNVVLVATEPLASAALVLGREQLQLSRTADQRVFQIGFPISRNINGELRMSSVNEPRAVRTFAISVRAEPDREPLVRLIQPADDLRLHSRDLLPIHYQAMDDYGLSELAVMAQVNSMPPISLPINRAGDARRLDGLYVLDLATLDVKIGDVVTVALWGADGAGRKVAGDASRSILISPRSIDIATHQRIAELKQSTQLAEAHQRELEELLEALKQIRQGDEPENEDMGERLKVSRVLASAAESAILLHQTILRAVAKSASAKQTALLAALVDKARVQSFNTERLAAMDARGDAIEALSDAAKPLTEGGRRLAEEIKVLSEGEQAKAILEDRANLAAAPASQPGDKAAAERLKETRRRAEEEIRIAVAELGLSSSTRDFAPQLQRRVDAAAQALDAAQVIDFEKAARQWAAEMGSAQLPPLAEQLASASTVEALRPDGDPIRARDLQLASKAAARLGHSPIGESAEARAARAAAAEFAPALTALEGEHRLALRPSEVRPPDEVKAIHAAAADARRKLSQWAAGSIGSADAEELALASAAEAARRRYEAAGLLDEKLTGKAGGEIDPEMPPHLRRTLERMRAMDVVSIDQEKLAELTARAAGEIEATDLEKAQRRVAVRIEELGAAKQGTTSREAAAAAMRRVQEELARMPQRMTGAMEAATALREANRQVEAAAKDVTEAPADKRAMAERMAEQARRAAAEARDEFDSAAAPLAGEVAETMARDLLAYAPESEDATHAITEQLQPALAVFQQTMRNGDRGAVDRSAQRVRTALERTQVALRDGQIKLLEQNPLTAARWFADAAAQALAERPPDYPKARQNQKAAAEALNRAWVSSLREAATDRLSLTPSFRSLLAPSIEGNKSFQLVLPGVRQWGTLSQRQPDAISAPSAETDSPTYQEALKIYFEALGKAQGKK